MPYSFFSDNPVKTAYLPEAEKEIGEERESYEWQLYFKYRIHNLIRAVFNVCNYFYISKDMMGL